jgi:hypothetical protein
MSETATAEAKIKSITGARVSRIQSILTRDGALKDKLSGKMTIIKDTKYHAEAVVVTEAIHKDGGEAYNIAKADVLDIARRILNVNDATGAAAPAENAESGTGAPNGAPQKFNQMVSVVSLLLSAISIADQHDGHPGNKGRLEKLKDLTDDYTKNAFYAAQK